MDHMVTLHFAQPTDPLVARAVDRSAESFEAHAGDGPDRSRWWRAALRYTGEGASPPGEVNAVKAVSRRDDLAWYHSRASRHSARLAGMRHMSASPIPSTAIGAELIAASVKRFLWRLINRGH